MGSKRLNFKNGERFGRLTIVGKNQENKSGRSKFDCICDCGKRTTVIGSKLKTGETKSCGCLSRELTSKRSKKHGMTNTREYIIWKNMKARCNNTNNINYHNYGGRGITICEEWYDFENFFADMGKCPSQKHSLDRIDNYGNYEPKNTKWSTLQEQANNKRNNINITYNGETKTVTEWSEITGIGSGTLKSRIKMGWAPVRILTEPVRNILSEESRTLELFGIRKTIGEWAKASPVVKSAFISRLNKGWTLTQSLVFHPMPIGKRYDDYINKHKRKGV